MYLVLSYWLNETDWSKYVTSPYILPGYKPVMRTDKMTSEEILNAYYYINSIFMKKKFRTKFGKRFLLNPDFYFDKIFKIKNTRDFISKLKAAGKILKRFIIKRL